MVDFSSIHKDFEDDLRRAAELLNLTNSFRDFGASTVPSEVEDHSVPWQEALDLVRIAPQVRTDLPIMSGSILLYLCGRFENFVREIVMAIGEGYASSVTSYAELPEVVRNEIFQRTLEVAKFPAKFNFEPAEATRIIKLLVDAIHAPPGTPVTIESRLLAITDANMHSRMMAEVFKRVGIAHLWRELGKQAPLKTFLGEPDDGRCCTAASVRLDEIMKKRNSVAHPTPGIAFPDSTYVQEALDYLLALSKVTLDLAQIPRRGSP